MTPTPAQALRHRQARTTTDTLRTALSELIDAVHEHQDILPEGSLPLRFDELAEAIEITRRCRETAAFLRGEA